ncbi:ATP-binding protein [Chitinasiproducens palmae]|uniref:histidine kinase n=1 Tax=Chitinasiproducens palmae TaxID=1770053 RepID=A0A1H2PMC3_9BURK|nr:ATP-binding protein [Chitinasiproducens palmae]SDV47728.1 two-component system, OmpR family, osmolarity sensor histidine kinase EnvZ [Chitinasiproducens palmae]
MNVARAVAPRRWLFGLDSLFGHLAVLVVVVLLFPHFAWYVLMRIERNEWLDQYSFDETAYVLRNALHDPAAVSERPESLDPLDPRASGIRDGMPPPGQPRDAGREPRGAVGPGGAPEQGADHGPDGGRTLSVRRMPAGFEPPPSDPHLPPGMQAFVGRLKARLPAATELRVTGGGPRPRVWVRMAPSEPWLMARMRLPRPEPQPNRMIAWLGVSFTAAVLFALLAAWRLQRPLVEVARASARVGGGERVDPLEEAGPRELRIVSRAFNQMVDGLAENERDRNVMLAGVAHDLRAPLARMRLRAELVEDEGLRAGLVRDTESLAHIVDEFMVFANDAPDTSEPIEVDAFCTRFVESDRVVHPAQPPLTLRAAAGAGFMLPRATLERVLTNLVENARAYGAPPIVIETAAAPDAATDAPGASDAARATVAAAWRLSVLDSGRGIAQDALSSATRPFVRLDPARGGNAHCGLGLAIVDRLARRAGGACRIGNRPEGGLRVDLLMPAVAPVPATPASGERDMQARLG